MELNSDILDAIKDLNESEDMKAALRKIVWREYINMESGKSSSRSDYIGIIDDLIDPSCLQDEGNP